MHGRILLSRGYVSYELKGPTNAQLVVMIHGFATPSFTFDHTVPALLDAGFRTLRFDLYGRGNSDKPKDIYSLDFFNRQLLELLHKLNLRAPYHLIGLSMGGAITVGFTALQPENVDKICLLSPAGIRQKKPLNTFIPRLPYIGEWLITTFGPTILTQGTRNNFVNPNAPELDDFYRRFREQISHPGFLQAIASTAIHMPLFDLEDAYRTIGQHGNPTLVIWGKKDKVLPFANSKRVKELIPQAEILPIDSGHLSQFEHPHLVNPALIQFLKN